MPQKPLPELKEFKLGQSIGFFAIIVNQVILCQPLKDACHGYRRKSADTKSCILHPST